MAEQKSLKQQNAWLINIAVVLHILGFLWVTLQPLSLLNLDQDTLMEKAQSMIEPGTISLGIIALLRLVMLGMLPAGLRDALVHWRPTHPLPGSRAFTKIAKMDPRTDIQTLEMLHGPLPSDANEQDLLFYTIYKKHCDELEVLDPHKSYLAMREISVLNFLFLIVLPFAGFFMADTPKECVGYVLCLTIAFVVTSFAAQNYAHRMVANVLALESHAYTNQTDL